MYIGAWPEAVATLYEDVDYGLRSLRLGPGDYYLDRSGMVLRAPAAVSALIGEVSADNRVSSVYVDCARATLFAEFDASGASLVVDRPTPNVGAIFNNVGSRVRVEAGVRAFTDADFRGDSVFLTEGLHKATKVALLDRISSVRVPAGYQLVLSTRRKTRAFVGAVPWVGEDLKDQARSARVSRAPVIYDRPFFRGGWSTLLPGRYTLAELGIPNDQLASIQVPSGWSVTLFDDASFGGTSQVCTRDDAAVQWPPTTSSLAVNAPPAHLVNDFVALGTDSLLAFDAVTGRWYTRTLVNGRMDRTDAGSRGPLPASRAMLWAGDFTGNGKSELLGYDPTDGNWWLGWIAAAR